QKSGQEGRQNSVVKTSQFPSFKTGNPVLKNCRHKSKQNMLVRADAQRSAAIIQCKNRASWQGTPASAPRRGSPVLEEAAANDNWLWQFLSFWTTHIPLTA
ncbi:MAG: hypothetical protein LBQ63_04300, partial [Deltaproteobacteria bacterium]|nr:hypothetical protein [Deltaproteobacteria bacterium]